MQTRIQPIEQTFRGQAASIKQIEADAAVFSRQNFGAISPSLYVPGGNTKVTKERAYAAMLEANPEAYAQYRAQHNAAPTIAALKAAGYELKR